MPGLTVLLLIILGWLVFNWLPGYLLLKRSDRGDQISQAIIRRYGKTPSNGEGGL
ncbi:MAG: hypothetical protein OWQ57_12400 [Sulfobacillus sp.]|nr:hypothetical protein [Sulfobacillus sp.]